MGRLTVAITGPAVAVTRRFSSGTSGNRRAAAARRRHCIDGSGKRREASVGMREMLLSGSYLGIEIPESFIN